MAAPLMAQVEGGQGEVFGFVGGMLPGDPKLTKDIVGEGGDGKFDIKNGVYFGGGFGYNLTRKWGIEGSFGFAPNLDWKAIINGNSEGGDTNIDIYTYSGNVLYHINPDSKGVIFVTAGVGGIKLKESETEQPLDKSYIQYNFGAGFKAHLTGPLYFRADFRDYIFKFDWDTMIDSTTVNAINSWTHNFTITAGVGFRF
jgi:outer membrane beta-barrel protein